MHLAIRLWFQARPIMVTSAAVWLLGLALGCFLTSSLWAGVAPNSDGSQSDNGANDPYYINAGNSFTFVNVFDDDVLIMNGGTISNHSRPEGYWRSPIRLLDHSHAIINGGLIQDVDTTWGTWGVHLEDQSRLTVNGGTFRQSGGSVGSLIYATGHSFTTINGGDFNSALHPSVATWFSGSVTINGGDFSSGRDDVVEHRGDDLVTINGGTFSGPSRGIVVRDGDLILSGGQFETDLDLLTMGGATELIARSASLGGAPLNEGLITTAGGVIDLIWRNGDAESLRFERQAGVIRLTLIPEPSTLIGCAAFAVAMLSQRKPRWCH